MLNFHGFDLVTDEPKFRQMDCPLTSWGCDRSQPADACEHLNAYHVERNLVETEGSRSLKLQSQYLLEMSPWPPCSKLDTVWTSLSLSVICA